MQKTDHLKKGPKSQAISKIDFSTPEIHELSSGITLYSLKTEDIGAIKFELVFEAGRLYEHKKMIAQTCSALISEGCEGWSSEKFQEFFHIAPIIRDHGKTAYFFKRRNGHLHFKKKAKNGYKSYQK